MYGWPFGAWARAGFDAWALGVEASTVIGMRTAKIAMGGAAADREAERMVAEKLESAFELQMALMTGGLGTTPLAGTTKVLRHYKRKVAANRRRLAR